MCHLRMAVIDLPTKFCATSSIQFGVIDIFQNPRWRPLPSCILKSCKFDSFVMLIVWYMSSISDLLQISVIVTEIDTFMLQTFIWWGHTNYSDFDFWSDIQVMWIWTFRRVDSVVFELCNKIRSNISYSHWDQCIYASDVHLITSHKLTSGFAFWSRGHLCMAVMDLRIKFGADIFIRSRVIDIFLKIQDGGRCHLRYSGYVILNIQACW